MAAAAVATVRELRAALVRSGEVRLGAVVGAIDAMSNTLCLVADRLSALETVGVAAGDAATMDLLHRAVAEVNTDEAVRARLAAAVSAAGGEEEGTEEMLVAKLLLDEFHVGLDDAARRQVADRTADVHATSMDFVGAAARHATSQGASAAVLGEWERRSEWAAAYAARDGAVEGNGERLLSMVHGRRELAQLLGHASPVAQQLRHYMYLDEGGLRDVLGEAADRVRGMTTRVFDDLQVRKEAPADVYYALAVEQRRREVTMRYLTLPVCLRGLELISERVFGLTVTPVAMAEGEAWHRDVRRVDVTCREKGPVGTVYLDLFDRAGKVQSACMATMACAIDRPADGIRQLPQLVLSMTLERGRMSYMDVHSLFHEWGHTLHGLLGATKYQHVSGVRTFPEQVEIPSVLFENFLESYTVVRQFARDADGMVMPEDVHKALLARERPAQVLNLHNDIVYGLADLDFFADDGTRGVTGDADAMSDHFDALVREHATVPLVSGAHTQFMHFAHYPGTYHTYLLAGMYSSSVWEDLFSRDPFDADAGAVFRAQFLERGGSREPQRTYEELFHGRPVSPAAYLGRVAK